MTAPRLAARRRALLFPVLLASLVTAQADDQAPAASAPAKAALTVSVVSPAMASVPVLLQANGNIAAWQEALVGAEAAGQGRLWLMGIGAALPWVLAWPRGRGPAPGHGAGRRGPAGAPRPGAGHAG